MADQREITKEYLELFITTVRKGGKVTFVESSNLLAVDHPSRGYIVLELADKIVDN